MPRTGPISQPTHRADETPDTLAWLAGVHAIAARHAGIGAGGAYVLRDLLAELDLHLRAAPRHLQELFRALPEATLAADAAVRQAAIEDEDFSWPVSPTMPPAALMGAACAQARALDAALQDASIDNGVPGTPEAYLCTDQTAYVIPRRLGSTDLPQPRDRQIYNRRGLLFNRVIPQHINAYWVEVTLVAAQPQRFFGAPLRLGAALFERFSAEFPPTTANRFRAAGVVCPSQAAQIRAQVKAARAQDCFAAVWPELTMPPDAQHVLEAALREWDGGKPAPALCVAGSWHTPREGIFHNISTIYNQFGVPAATLCKAIAYADGSHGREDIELGRTIPLLVVDGVLVGVAICKDFCDLGTENPYLTLGADVILVPSMGDVRTMASHHSRAHALRSSAGTDAFVVQQHEGDDADPPLGYVLAPGHDFVLGHAHDTAVRQTWTVHGVGLEPGGKR